MIADEDHAAVTLRGAFQHGAVGAQWNAGGVVID
jgi:hypothetical protein